ncbi:MAG: class I SAM-dependent methyltransferase [Gemmatimonadaceae bacterium]
MATLHLKYDLMTMTANSTATKTPSTAAEAHAAEVARGERFKFGENWRRFLENMSEDRANEAVLSLKRMLGRDSLKGLTFLDIGSGSGLFSLAAQRMGATVTSFDYDSDSFGCTNELRSRYANSDPTWTVMQGSVLDNAFMNSLGKFDVVYSWGVLHHTGHMWDAINNAEKLVAPGGQFFIAIYNHQGPWSDRWTKIKKFYCSGPVGRMIVSGTIIPFWVGRDLVADIVFMRNPIKRYSDYGKNRGMSVVRDWFDWLGGYPFEAAKPEDIILPINKRGYRLTNLTTQYGSVGCVEYVFQHDPKA